MFKHDQIKTYSRKYNVQFYLDTPMKLKQGLDDRTSMTGQSSMEFIIMQRLKDVAKTVIKIKCQGSCQERYYVYTALNYLPSL